MIFQQLLPISHYPNCRGEKSKRVVLQEQLDAYLEAYQKSNSNLAQFYDILKNHLGRGSDEAVVLPRNIPIDSIAICPVCRKPMTVNTIPNGTSVVSCTGWPDCKASGFFPRGAWLKNRGSPCQSCPGFYRAVFHFPVGTVPNSTMIGQYQGCLGCDADLKAVINIRENRQNQAVNRSSSNSTNQRPSNADRPPANPRKRKSGTSITKLRIDSIEFPYSTDPWF